jgi:hypothetical protein
MRTTSKCSESLGIIPSVGEEVPETFPIVSVIQGETPQDVVITLLAKANQIHFTLEEARSILTDAITDKDIQTPEIGSSLGKHVVPAGVWRNIWRQPLAELPSSPVS